MMVSSVRIALLSIIFLYLSSIAVMAQNSGATAQKQLVPTAPPIQKFGDWSKVCQDTQTTSQYPKAKDKTLTKVLRECFLSQTIVTQAGEGGNSAQGRVLTANVSVMGSSENDKKLVLILFLPFGIAVQSDIVVTIENAPQLKGKVDTCLQTGCRIAFVLDDKTKAAMKLVKVAQIIFSAVGGAPVGVNLSLVGLSEGTAGLK